jgi:hypothetical protein
MCAQMVTCRQVLYIDEDLTEVFHHEQSLHLGDLMMRSYSLSLPSAHPTLMLTLTLHTDDDDDGGVG